MEDDVESGMGTGTGSPAIPQSTVAATAAASTPAEGMIGEAETPLGAALPTGMSSPDTYAIQRDFLARGEVGGASSVGSGTRRAAAAQTPIAETLADLTDIHPVERRVGGRLDRSRRRRRAPRRWRRQRRRR